jgi:hypothetical protein
MMLPGMTPFTRTGAGDLMILLILENNERRGRTDRVGVGVASSNWVG